MGFLRSPQECPATVQQFDYALMISWSGHHVKHEVQSMIYARSFAVSTLKVDCSSADGGPSRNICEESVTPYLSRGHRLDTCQKTRPSGPDNPLAHLDFTSRCHVTKQAAPSNSCLSHGEEETTGPLPVEVGGKAVHRGDRLS